MLSKIIKLVDIYDDYMKTDFKISENDYEISQFMKLTIEAFNTITDEVVRIKEMLKSQSYQIGDLRKRVKRLEEKDGDHPNEEEIRNMKVGGTD